MIFIRLYTPLYVLIEPYTPSDLKNDPGHSHTASIRGFLGSIASGAKTAASL